MQANPSFALDCCTTCPGTTTLTPVPPSTGVRQVWDGNGPPTPVTTVFSGMDPTISNLYYDDLGGAWYPWDIANQQWVVPPEVP